MKSATLSSISSAGFTPELSGLTPFVERLLDETALVLLIPLLLLTLLLLVASFFTALDDEGAGELERDVLGDVECIIPADLNLGAGIKNSK